MSEASKPIFVIGGTGRHGGTGAYAARQLLKVGIPVRALVRQRDDRAKSLEELGAEVVVGDLHDRRSLIPALEGTVTAYFTYPIAGGIVDEDCESLEAMTTCAARSSGAHWLHRARRASAG